MRTLPCMFTPVWYQWPQFFRGYPRWLYRRERILAIRRHLIRQRCYGCCSTSRAASAESQ